MSSASTPPAGLARTVPAARAKSLGIAPLRAGCAARQLGDARRDARQDGAKALGDIATQFRLSNAAIGAGFAKCRDSAEQAGARLRSGALVATVYEAGRLLPRELAVAYLLDAALDRISLDALASNDVAPVDVIRAQQWRMVAFHCAAARQCVPQPEHRS